MTHVSISSRLALIALLVLTCFNSSPAAANSSVSASPADTLAADVPFSDDFESGTFGADWSTVKENNGVVEVNGDYPHSGAKSVFLGQKLAGHASASLVLALDLTGQTDVFLDFWVRATGGFNYRKVYISDDGGTTWELIRELNNTPQSFKREILNIADAATAEGLELNNKFRISFYYGSALGRASDGMVVDDIQIGTQDPTAGLKVYLPLLRRPR